MAAGGLNDLLYLFRCRLEFRNPLVDIIKFCFQVFGFLAQGSEFILRRRGCRGRIVAVSGIGCPPSPAESKSAAKAWTPAASESESESAAAAETSARAESWIGISRSAISGT